MPGVMLDAANYSLARAMARAQQDFGRTVCVAICETLGFLVAFARREGAPVRSIRISQGKAHSAARMGAWAESFLARSHEDGIEISYFCDPLLTARPGGGVLKDESGTLLRVIGISGLTSAEDQVISDHIAEHFRAKDRGMAR
jgi:glc operon protein GlcG